MLVCIGDPILAKAILGDPTTTRPSELYSAFDGVTSGPCIVSKSGMKWKSSRKAVSQAFSSRHIRRMNQVCMDKTEKWIATVLNQGEPFDPAEEMVSLTLDVICHAAFEYDMTDKEMRECKLNMSLCLTEFGVRSSMNPFRQFYFWDKERKQAFKAAQALKAFASCILESFRNKDKEISTTTDEDKEANTLIRIISNSSAYANDTERLSDIVAFLVAGHDTTGYSIAWCLLELAKNPDVAHELRSKLRKMPPSEQIKADGLRNVIKESHRLNPVAADGAGRRTGKDFFYEYTSNENGDGGTVSSRTIRIPKGTLCMPAQIITNRQSYVCGNDPDSFRPSRWDADEMQTSVNSEQMKALSAISPFSFGQFNCIGQRLADAEMNAVLARLVTSYEFELVDEGRPRFALTMKPHGTKLKARKLD